MWAREAPLTHDGTVFHIPLAEGEGTGLGKALKIIGRPERSRIPIWVAALGEKNVAMTAEVAEGWLLPCSSWPRRPRTSSVTR